MNDITIIKAEDSIIIYNDYQLQGVFQKEDYKGMFGTLEYTSVNFVNTHELNEKGNTHYKTEQDYPFNFTDIPKEFLNYHIDDKDD